MQTVKVDITPGYEQSKIIYVSQYDVGREFKINLSDGSGDYIPPEGAVARIKGTKPSTLGFDVQGVISGSSVTFVTNYGMTDEAGRIPVEVSIKKGEALLLGSKNLYLDIEEATHHPDTPDGSKEFTIPELTIILQKLHNENENADENIARMEDLKEATEAAAEAAASVFHAEGNVVFSVLPSGQVRETWTLEEE